MYKTIDISRILGVVEETVRKWLKSGKLKGELELSGWVWYIYDDGLKEFLNNNPKYKKRYRQYCIDHDKKLDYILMFIEEIEI